VCGPHEPNLPAARAVPFCYAARSINTVVSSSNFISLADGVFCRHAFEGSLSRLSARTHAPLPFSQFRMVLVLPSGFAAFQESQAVFRRFTASRAVSIRMRLRPRGPTNASISRSRSSGSQICARRVFICHLSVCLDSVPYLCVLNKKPPDFPHPWPQVRLAIPRRRPAKSGDLPEQSPAQSRVSRNSLLRISQRSNLCDFTSPICTTDQFRANRQCFLLRWATVRSKCSGCCRALKFRPYPAPPAPSVRCRLNSLRRAFRPPIQTARSAPLSYSCYSRCNGELSIATHSQRFNLFLNVTA